MMTDPISDMLARIRNGALARHDRVDMPHSFLKKNIADVLKQEGYVDDVRESEGDGRKTLTLVLRYGRGKDSAIDGLRRVSAPGRRVYVRHVNRCKVCGRGRAYYRKFELCRICLRLYSLRGEIPGVIKASW